MGAWECAFCGTRYADEQGSAKSDATVSIPALGHTAPDASGCCTRCGEQIEPSDEPTDNPGAQEPPGEVCKYCGKVHGTDMIGRLLKFFHSIIYFFSHLFG